MKICMKKFAIAVMCVAITLSLVPAAAFVQPAQEAQAKTGKPTIIVTCANTEKVTLKKGTKYNLKVKVSKGSKHTYKSSKKSVVIVSKKGVLKAKKLGKSTITVKAKKSGKTVTKKVKVTVIKKSKYKKVKKIAVEVSNTKLTIGQTTKTNVKFKPSNASNKNVIYKSSNSSVLSVSDKGIVTAKSTGSAKITVQSCCNPKAKASEIISVEKQTSTDCDPMSGTCGTCKWDIDDAGKLTIAPLNGETGELANWITDVSRDEYKDYYPPWFGNSDKIKSVDIVGNVVAKTCRNMFASSSFESIDLSNFDTSKVKDMSWMFKNCSVLEKITVSDKFKIPVGCSSEYMFESCENIKGQNGTTYSEEHIDGTYARIDGGTSAPGYFWSVSAA